MKPKKLLLLFAILMPMMLKAQTTEMTHFRNFIGKWEMEGKWSNGKTFKQEVILEWGLNQNIVKVKTYGVTNPETGAYGLRNEGIRAWNKQKDSILFWEFDIYGGITEGTCEFEEKNLHYLYDYNGEQLKESWIFIDKNTYSYEIVSLKDGKVNNSYLKSTYKRIVE